MSNKTVAEGRCPSGTALSFFRNAIATATPLSCVVWPYMKGGQMGYGQIWLRKQKSKWYTHRLAWKVTKGKIGKLHVLHTCDNPPCFNPYHLFLGTEKDNRADQKSKRRTMLGTRNGCSKLTENQVREIRRLYQHGVLGRGQIALADRFGVTRIAIRKIVKRETWGWLQ